MSGEGPLQRAVRMALAPAIGPLGSPMRSRSAASPVGVRSPTPPDHPGDPPAAFPTDRPGGTVGPLEPVAGPRPERSNVRTATRSRTRSERATRGTRTDEQQNDRTGSTSTSRLSSTDDAISPTGPSGHGGPNEQTRRTDEVAGAGDRGSPATSPQPGRTDPPPAPGPGGRQTGRLAADGADERGPVDRAVASKQPGDVHEPRGYEGRGGPHVPTADTTVRAARPSRRAGAQPSSNTSSAPSPDMSDREDDGRSSRYRTGGSARAGDAHVGARPDPGTGDHPTVRTDPLGEQPEGRGDTRAQPADDIPLAPDTVGSVAADEPAAGRGDHDPHDQDPRAPVQPTSGSSPPRSPPPTPTAGQIRIGRIDVVVLAPEAPSRDTTPDPRRRADTLSSRRYLRRA
jgi:hypothetical protein